MSEKAARGARRPAAWVFTLSLAGGRELEASRAPSPDPGEWLRLALFRRYGPDRMCEGGFCCKRDELRLLLLALERSRSARGDCGLEEAAVTLGKHEMGTEEAAEALGVTVAELLASASDGNIPNAILDRDGWRFRRLSIERIRDRRAA